MQACWPQAWSCGLKYCVAPFGSGDTGVRLQNDPARLLFHVSNHQALASNSEYQQTTVGVLQIPLEIPSGHQASGHRKCLFLSTIIQHLGPYQALPLRIKPLALTLWHCSRNLLVCLACSFATLALYRLPSVLFLVIPLSQLSPFSSFPPPLIWVCSGTMRWNIFLAMQGCVAFV